MHQDITKHLKTYFTDEKLAEYEIDRISLVSEAGFNPAFYFGYKDDSHLAYRITSLEADSIDISINDNEMHFTDPKVAADTIVLGLNKFLKL